MKNDQELNWVGENWIVYIKDNHNAYYKELKKEGILNKTALKKQTEYEQNVKIFEEDDLPPGGARELARELLYSNNKLKSIINIDVFYNESSLGIAIVDPIVLSYVKIDLRKTIQNPVLIIEVNPIKHIYFRGTPSMFQIATVVYKDDIWFLENFIFDGTLELAQSKFKEGKIIYGKAN